MAPAESLPSPLERVDDTMIHKEIHFAIKLRVVPQLPIAIPSIPSDHTNALPLIPSIDTVAFEDSRMTTEEGDSEPLTPPPGPATNIIKPTVFDTIAPLQIISPPPSPAVSKSLLPPVPKATINDLPPEVARDVVIMLGLYDHKRLLSASRVTRLTYSFPGDLRFARHHIKTVCGSHLSQLAHFSFSFLDPIYSLAVVGLHGLTHKVVNLLFPDFIEVSGIPDFLSVDGQRELFHSPTRDSTPFINVLIDAAKAGIIDPTLNDFYAFYIAALFDSVPLVEALMSVPPDRITTGVVLGEGGPADFIIAELLLNTSSRLICPNILEHILTLCIIEASNADDLALRIACQFGNVWAVRRLLWTGTVDPTANNYEPFILAVSSGHFGVVKEMLNTGMVDVTCRANYPVRGAAKKGYIEMLEFFLSMDEVDPAAGDNEAVVAACENGHIEVVKLLLRTGRVDFCADNGAALTRAYGHPEIIHLLLQRHRRAIRRIAPSLLSPTPTDFTPLMPDQIRKLSDDFALLPNPDALIQIMQLRWVNGIPPHKSKTEWAEFKHDLKFFETLPPITQYRLREAVTHILSVLKGDAATVISETDGDGEIFPTDYSHNSYFTATTLLDLLDHGLRFDANLVKVILTDFLDIFEDRANAFHNMLLGNAVECSTIEIVRLLIDAGADVNAVFDSDAVPSECALETAAKRAFMTSVLKVEMTFPRVVEVAASRRDAESGILVEELLGRGAVPTKTALEKALQVSNERGVVALIKGLADKALEGDGAKYVEGMDAVRLLKFVWDGIIESSDPRLISMDLIDQCLAEEVFGRLCVVGEENAVVFALERKLIRVAKKIALEPSGERLRIDLKGGSLVVNMLHWASEVGCLEIVKALVESKIVEAEVGDQYAIRSACSGGHLEVVKYLIGLEGVDPAYDDSLPLRQACAFGHTHIVSLLLRDGRADPSAYDSQAVDLALEHEHADVALLLVLSGRLSICLAFATAATLDANHFESDSNRVTRQYLKTFAVTNMIDFEELGKFNELMEKDAKVKASFEKIFKTGNLIGLLRKIEILKGHEEQILAEFEWLKELEEVLGTVGGGDRDFELMIEWITVPYKLMMGEQKKKRVDLRGLNEGEIRVLMVKACEFAEMGILREVARVLEGREGGGDIFLIGLLAGARIGRVETSEGCCGSVVEILLGEFGDVVVKRLREFVKGGGGRGDVRKLVKGIDLRDEEVEGVTALFGLMKASEMGDWEEGALKKLVPMGVLCRLSPMIFLAMTCVHFAEYGADVGVLVNGFLRGLDEEEVRAFEEVVGDAADAVESSDNGAEADGWRRRKMLRGFVEWVDDIIENAVVEGDEECVKDVLDIPSLSRRLGDEPARGDALRVRWLTAAIKKILTLRTISLPLLNQLLDRLQSCTQALPGSLLPVSATQSHEIFNLILSRLNRLPDVREGSLALIAASNAGCVEVVEMLVGRGMQEGWVDPGFNESEALSCAAWKGFEEIVTLLVGTGRVDEEKMKVHPFGEEIFDLF